MASNLWWMGKKYSTDETTNEDTLEKDLVSNEPKPINGSRNNIVIEKAIDTLYDIDEKSLVLLEKAENSVKFLHKKLTTSSNEVDENCCEECKSISNEAINVIENAKQLQAKLDIVQRDLDHVENNAINVAKQCNQYETSKGIFDLILEYIYYHRRPLHPEVIISVDSESYRQHMNRLSKEALMTSDEYLETSEDHSELLSPDTINISTIDKDVTSAFLFGTIGGTVDFDPVIKKTNEIAIKLITAINEANTVKELALAAEGCTDIGKSKNTITYVKLLQSFGNAKQIIRDINEKLYDIKQIATKPCKSHVIKSIEEKANNLAIVFPFNEVGMLMLGIFNGAVIGYKYCRLKEDFRRINRRSKKI